MTDEKLVELISEAIGLGLVVFFIFYSKTKENLREKKILGFPFLNLAYFLGIFFLARIIMVLLK